MFVLDIANGCKWITVALARNYKDILAAEGNSWTPCCSTCLVGFLLRMAGQRSISSTQSAAVPGVAISIGILLPHCPGRWNVKLCEIQRGTGNLKTVNILINPGVRSKTGRRRGGRYLPTLSLWVYWVDQNDTQQVSAQVHSKRLYRTQKYDLFVISRHPGGGTYIHPHFVKKLLARLANHISLCRQRRITKKSHGESQL